MTQLVHPGSRADLEFTVVDKDGNLVDVYAVTFEVFDPSGTSVTSGGASWESQGTYVAFWTVPSAAVIGDRYKVTFTVTVDATGATEKVSFILQIGGAVL